MIILETINVLGQLFSQPLHVPTKAVSLLWAIPICLSFATVYKAIKIDKIEAAHFVREVTFLFLTIIGFLILGAVGLLGIAFLVHQA